MKRRVTFYPACGNVLPYHMLQCPNITSTLAEPTQPNKPVDLPNNQTERASEDTHKKDTNGPLSRNVTVVEPN